MITTNSKPPIRRRVLATAGFATLLLVLLVGAVAVVEPLPTEVPTGTLVSPEDTAGVNVLEPPTKSLSTEPKTKPVSRDRDKREVEEWTPTGGGQGGSGSPKK